jgi:hypothetical protein
VEEEGCDWLREGERSGEGEGEAEEKLERRPLMEWER